MVQSPPKRRGRPPKNQKIETTKPARRGRPPKPKTEEQVAAVEPTETPQAPEKRGPGKKPYVRDDIVAQKVEVLIGCGVDQITISTYLGMHRNTLTKYYGPEIEKGKSVAICNAAAKLYQRGMNGSDSCLIFWLKTQAGWSERKLVDHSSSDGSMSPKAIVDLGDKSPEEIMELAKIAFDR